MLTYRQLISPLTAPGDGQAARFEVAEAFGRWLTYVKQDPPAFAYCLGWYLRLAGYEQPDVIDVVEKELGGHREAFEMGWDDALVTHIKIIKERRRNA